MTRLVRGLFSLRTSAQQLGSDLKTGLSDEHDGDRDREERSASTLTGNEGDPRQSHQPLDSFASVRAHPCSPGKLACMVQTADLRVASVNVNGIRAVARRDGLAWLRESDADVIALQEVRADDDTLRKTLADNGMGDWSCVHAESATPGRNGVAILARADLVDAVHELPVAEFDDSGRWVEATLATRVGTLTIASAYVHTGEAKTGRQTQKYRFLKAVNERMADLLTNCDDQHHVVVAGDFNVARSKNDIKNWKGNIGKAGFLPHEQRYLGSLEKAGWMDLSRAFSGDVPGPYTWWSWRGQAFDNDAGWRIDYLWSSPHLAARIDNVLVARAATYAQRWSDHAPVVADFTIEAKR